MQAVFEIKPAYVFAEPNREAKTQSVTVVDVGQNGKRCVILRLRDEVLRLGHDGNYLSARSREFV